ncbi:hypothetical protein D3C72_1800240 [compost metagenome]
MQEQRHAETHVIVEDMACRAVVADAPLLARGIDHLRGIAHHRVKVGDRDHAVAILRDQLALARGQRDQADGQPVAFGQRGIEVELGRAQFDAVPVMLRGVARGGRRQAE